MGERLIYWLATQANAYLLWLHERERRGMPRCPDCRAPVIDCSCEDDARLRDDFDAAFNAGVQAEQEARR